MTKLNSEHVTEINDFLKEKGLFHIVNTYLKDNNLSNFEVHSLELKPKSSINQVNDGLTIECDPGFEKVEVVDHSGKIVIRCIPV